MNNEYTLEKLAEATGGVAPAVGGDSGDWIKGMNELAKNVNQMLHQYNLIRGITPQGNNPPQETGGGALTGKFAPMSGNTKDISKPTSNKDIRIDQLLQLIKQSLEGLANQGAGDKPLFQVLSALPVSVNQALAVIGAVQNET